MATGQRVYMNRDDEVEAAFEAAVENGLTGPDAPIAKKLRAMVLYAAERLAEERERDEVLASYEALAQDEERLATIRAWNRIAAEDGLL